MVLTKAWNRMERNGLFHSIIFRILLLKAIRYLSLNPKDFDLSIPKPKSKLSC